MSTDPTPVADPVVDPVVDNGGTPTPEPGGTPTPQDPAAEPVIAAADPAVDPAADPVVADPTPEPAKPVDWRERRLGEVSAKNRELAARIAELEAKAAPKADAPPQPQVGADGKPLYTEAEVLTRADQLAKARVEEARFNDQCNDVFSKGTSKFEDFQSTLAAYAQLGGLSRPFVSAVLQAGDKAPDLLYSLGKDMNEAARVMSLPPVEQAFELARLSLKLDEKPKVEGVKVSNAPAPVKPKVGGGARAEPTVYDDSASIADWMAVRNKQLEARRGTRH